MADKYALTILKTGEGETPYKAAASLDKYYNDSTGNFQKDLALIENDYNALVNSVGILIINFSRQKNPDPRIYWLVADNISRFLSRIDEMGFYLIKCNDTFARDIGLSGSSIGKMLSFHRRFSNISSVDPTVLWSRYRDNKIET